VVQWFFFDVIHITGYGFTEHQSKELA